MGSKSSQGHRVDSSPVVWKLIESHPIREFSVPGVLPPPLRSGSTPNPFINQTGDFPFLSGENIKINSSIVFSVSLSPWPVPVLSSLRSSSRTPPEKVWNYNLWLQLFSLRFYIFWRRLSTPGKLWLRAPPPLPPAPGNRAIKKVPLFSGCEIARRISRNYFREIMELRKFFCTHRS